MFGKIIQIFKDGKYMFALTDKGGVFCGVFHEEHPEKFILAWKQCENFNANGEKIFDS